MAMFMVYMFFIFVWPIVTCMYTGQSNLTTEPVAEGHTTLGDYTESLDQVSQNSSLASPTPSTASDEDEADVTLSTAGDDSEVSADDDTLPDILITDDINDTRFDCVVVITDDWDRLGGNLSRVKDALVNYSNVDASIKSGAGFLVTDAVPSKRLVISNTGPLNRDQDDVRRFADATKKGIKRAKSAGSTRPLLVRPEGEYFERTATLVSALALLENFYVPLQVKEFGRSSNISKFGIWYSDLQRGQEEISLVRAIEAGRVVARDIAGADPERMNPERVEEYVLDAFRNSNIQMKVTRNVTILNKEYPLFGAVNRAANMVERHRGRLIQLEYTGSGEITRTLFIVGKGVTFDTGGASIKSAKSMKGMSRDKSGAAAAAGFMKILSILKPKNIKVIAAMPLVRNSAGADNYVLDEIITSRAGVRVRVINTDAEGRMIMGDVLCELKDKALNAVNPHLVTIATLTGHALRTVGDSYSIVMDNGPAKELNTARSMQAAAGEYGEPLEVSTIRREDYSNYKGSAPEDDLRQVGKNGNRGHQGATAFLIMASGLDKHGKDSNQPLPYTHFDIAAAGFPPDASNAVPIIALIAHFVLGQDLSA